MYGLIMVNLLVAFGIGVVLTEVMPDLAEKVRDCFEES